MTIRRPPPAAHSPWRRRAVLAGAALALAACSGARMKAPLAHTADEQAIRAARMAQNDAIAAKDPDAIAYFWTDDVVIRRGLGPLVVGREGYRALFSDDSDVIYVRLPSSIEVSEQWPLAFETGDWTGRPGGATAPAVIRGRYSAQWVKRSGRWLIRAEVFVALACEGVGCGWPAAP